MICWLNYIVYPQINPVAVRIGPLAIRWYGLAYVAGFALSYLVLHRLIRKGMLRITPQGLSDLFAWLAAGVILGGRLGWWLFYHRPGPEPEPWWEPIAIWHGGMSFHGAITAVVLVFLVWSWQNKVSPFHIGDVCALVAPIGLFLGRIANFINAELYGRPTDLPWGVLFPGQTVPRHPSQLYEALLEGPVMAGVLWAFWRFGRPREGQLGGLFLILYALFRILVEFVREPDEQVGFVAFGWLTMGQLLSAFLALFGLVLMWMSRRARHVRL